MLQCNMKLPFLHRVNPCLKPVSVGCNRGLLLLPRLDRKTAAAVNSHARSDFLKFERRWLYLARGFESEMQVGRACHRKSRWQPCPLRERLANDGFSSGAIMTIYSAIVPMK
jgi:hypothetical protein